MTERVALLTNTPSPYRLPMFKALAEMCDLFVLFDQVSEPNRKWRHPGRELGFRHKYLAGLALPFTRVRPAAYAGPNLARFSRDTRYLQMRPGVLPGLARLRPDIIVSLEMGLRTLQAAAYAWVTGTPLIIWWEGTPHSEGWVGPFKRQLRRILVARAQRFWCNGKESAELLRTYGAKDEAIDTGITGVDVAYFRDAVMRGMGQRAALRAKWSLSGVTFLYVGQFTERKGLAFFLDALGILPDLTSQPWSALFVGEGSLEDSIRAWRDAHPELRVAVEGFLQQDELWRAYAAADVVVVPTLDDNWSLVVLEAMAAGLPQIMSIFNGGTSDLLTDARFGIAVDPTDVAALAKALAIYVEHPPARLASGEVSEVIDYYGPRSQAERAVASIKRSSTFRPLLQS